MDLLESFLIVRLDRLAVSEVGFHMRKVADDSFPHVPGHWWFMQQVVVGVNWAVHGEKELVSQHLAVFLHREDVSFLVKVADLGQLDTTSSNSQSNVLSSLQLAPVRFAQRWCPNRCPII